MNTREEYKPVSNSMALSIRKDYKIMVLRKATSTAIRVSLKTILYALFLTLANVII